MGMYTQVYAIKSADIPGLIAEPERIYNLFDSDQNAGSAVSLEKAWDGLHFLLTSSAQEAEPLLGFLLQGGEAIGEDRGYGPARLLRPEVVKQLDPALAAVSEDQLWSRFDPAQMKAQQIYPDIWDEPEEDLREEYLFYFRELKRLVKQANDRGMALVVVLS